MRKTLTAAVCVVAACPLMLGCDESSRAQTAEIATLAQRNVSSKPAAPSCKDTREACEARCK